MTNEQIGQGDWILRRALHHVCNAFQRAPFTQYGYEALKDCEYILQAARIRLMSEITYQTELSYIPKYTVTLL
jgi:hypothetical protein